MAKNTGSINNVSDVLFGAGFGNWHTTESLKAVGGPNALRRVREMRAQGQLIEARRVEGSRQWEYRAI